MKSLVDKVDTREFVRLWNDDEITRIEIASHFGIHKSSLSKLAKILGLRRCRGQRPARHRAKDPTPDEIRQRCLEIQARWSPERFERPMRARPRFYIGGSL